MKKRRDRLWILTLLLVIVLGARYFASRQAGFYVSWEVSDGTDLSNPYRLTVSGDCLQSGRSTRPFCKADQAELLRALEGAGLWDLPDCNERDTRTPLFTRLEVRLDDRISLTHWRGVSHQHLRVADALFGSPAGKEAIQGLTEVTARYPGPPPAGPLGECRQEILLEHVPAARVIPLLRYMVPQAKFIPHPTMNIFYVMGVRRDILHIKEQIPKLDRWPFLQE